MVNIFNLGLVLAGLAASTWAQDVPCPNFGCWLSTCTPDGQGSYDCSCKAGFTGVFCETDIDNCVGVSCVHGVCVDLPNRFECECDAGYRGSRCNTNINECLSAPCQNGASCNDGVNGYDCSCVLGYEGVHCETNIDDCLTNSCTNGATCVDGVNEYSCTCVPGFIGVYCETNFDECASNACMHGATCTDLVNGFECTCMPGYTGILCETDINECEPTPCANGVCIEDAIASYMCDCTGTGYEGTHCEINSDDCHSTPCLNGATCHDFVRAYTCTCAAGFTGFNCETNIDDCVTHSCVNGLCVDGVDTYTCDCFAGYAGRYCTTDIDECASAPCQHGATCTDVVNGYECSCVLGYSGVHCETDIDDCLGNSECLNGAVCVDRVNNFTCECAVAGYTGYFCETDIDECIGNTCQNGATCTDQVNGYVCDCVNGYTGIYCETDIDDCMPDPCVNGSCTDFVASYTCTCDPGFTGTNCDLEIIDGGVSQWGTWSSCSTTCSEGIETRTRTCDNPIPQNGGLNCVDALVETRPCNLIECSDAALSAFSPDLFGCLCHSSSGSFECTPAVPSCTRFCGPYQFTYKYYAACSALPYKVSKSSFKTCAQDAVCAKQCVANYLHRHTVNCSAIPSMPTNDEMARTHIGGPTRCLKSTKKLNAYADSVKSCLATAAINECTPTYCGNAINECTPTYCGNGGTCVDAFGTATCTCPGGFGGPKCLDDLAFEAIGDRVVQCICAANLGKRRPRDCKMPYPITDAYFKDCSTGGYLVSKATAVECANDAICAKTCIRNYVYKHAKTCTGQPAAALEDDCQGSGLTHFNMPLNKCVAPVNKNYAQSADFNKCCLRV